MIKFSVLWLTIMLVLLPMAAVVGCQQQSTPALSPSLPPAPTTGEESAELQARGNGIVELVTEPVYHGTYSAKLAIPEEYNFSDAARIAIPLDGVKLEGITSLFFWCYVDAETPANVEGYWVPYITFELDTDGEPGCDTWVIGGAGVVQQSSEAWFKITMDGSWLFHVSSVFNNYTSPFPVSDMGTFTQISAAIGPDGKTPLSDCTVSKLRIAIGN